MNPLLDQFVSEARDLLETVGSTLLELERSYDPERINRVFRAIHTIKGGSGLFEIEPFTVAVHQAEDLLDALREGRGRFGDEVAEGLLATVDQVSRWLDELEADGRLADDAELRSRRLVERLAELDTFRGSEVPDGSNAPDDELRVPEWFSAWPEGLRKEVVAAAEAEPGRPLVFVEYRPDEECFFTGIDPVLLATAVPGLAALVAEVPEGTPSLADLDPHRCHLVLRAVYVAEPEEVRGGFAFVEDEVQLRVGALDRPPEPPLAESPELLETARLLVDEQLRSLAVDGPEPLLEGRLRSAATLADRVVAHLAVDRPASRALARALEQRAVDPMIAHFRDLRAAIASHEASATAPVHPVDEGTPTSSPGRVARHLKVEVERVDALMDLAGELVVAKNALPYLARRATEEYGASRLAKELMEHYGVFSRICEELQSAVTSVRMMAVGNAFGRFPRLVRDLSRRQGKAVRLVLEGEDTEADKAIVEDLAEPLVHLVRNAIDHGIESPEQRMAEGKPREATLRLVARPATDRVEIVVSDDGRGIDPGVVRERARQRGLDTPEALDAMSDAELVQLVFAPGFSTAASVSDVSGRGVGMDAVRSAVEALSGSVRLDSQPGRGTAVTLTLPLSTAVSRIMMVEVGEHVFGLPMSVICETLRVPRHAVRRIKDREGVVVRGGLLPVYRLRNLLGLRTGEPRAEEHIVVMEVDGEEAAIIVDRLVEGMDVVMKPLSGVMAGIGPYRGTTLLGDGRVLLVLDMEEVVRCP